MVTTIVLLVGDVAKLGARASEMLAALRYFAERDTTENQLILVVDGPQWQGWVNDLQPNPASIARIKVVTMPAATHLPGEMVNRVFAAVTTDLVGFVSIGSEISTWYANLPGLTAALQNQGVLPGMAAGYRGPGEARTAANGSFLVHQDDQFSSDYPHAWLQMLDLVPMSNSLISAKLIRSLGGFSDAAAMQAMWWWEFTLRVSRNQLIVSLPLQPVPMIGWHHFPFEVAMAESVDQNLRTMMRLGGERGRLRPARPDEAVRAAMASDVAMTVEHQSWRDLPAELRQRLIVARAKKQRPLKIAVLGGVNEPAHNQLCFFNYFALMREWNLLSWRSLLDERASIDDLADCDLVIFSRVRSDNGVALIKACAERNIRTMYMLDDNWFWLGREWLEYADIFAPGKKPYENFLSCVRLADTTLTYSAPLAEDLAPFARRVKTLPTNVDLQMFPPRSAGAVASVAPKTTTVIGYVGSLRKNMLAFDALVALAKRRADVSIFVMSNMLPPEFADLPADRVHFEPYQFNYEGYAATVTRAAPDILVAPVGRSRFEASKCPNKFLEISACGAAGVYSRAEPYLSYVVESETGVFADDTLESWTAAIESLIDAPENCQKMAARARVQVANHYATAAVLPVFLNVLIEALSGDGRAGIAGIGDQSIHSVTENP